MDFSQGVAQAGQHLGRLLLRGPDQPFDLLSYLPIAIVPEHAFKDAERQGD